jgi:hypothetical protein
MLWHVYQLYVYLECRYWSEQDDTDAMTWLFELPCTYRYPAVSLERHHTVTNDEFRASFICRYKHLQLIALPSTVHLQYQQCMDN